MENIKFPYHKSIELTTGDTLDLTIKDLGRGRYVFIGDIGDLQVVIGEFQTHPFEKKGSVEEITVYSQFRRRGIATAVYDTFEYLGFIVVPSDNVKPDGRKFWNNRKKEHIW